jgi:hypothetical protein
VVAPVIALALAASACGGTSGATTTQQLRQPQRGGTLTIGEDSQPLSGFDPIMARLHEDQAAVENLVFDPTNVTSGIELSDDPILHFRSQVYGESYNRRTQEQRPTVMPE